MRAQCTRKPETYFKQILGKYKDVIYRPWSVHVKNNFALGLELMDHGLPRWSGTFKSLSQCFSLFGPPNVFTIR